MGAPRTAWSHRLDGPITQELVADGDDIFVIVDGRVHCFDPRGVERWRSAVGASGPPWVDGDQLLVAGPAGQVLALNRADGLVRATLPSGGSLVGPPFPIEGAPAWATDSGTVRGAAGWLVQATDSVTHSPASDGWVYFMPTATAELISGQSDRVRWRAVLPGPAPSPPLRGPDSVFTPYAGAQGGPGGVMALNPDTGMERWRTPLEGSPVGGLAFGGSVFVGDSEAGVVALDPATGAVRWSAPVDGSISTAPILSAYGLFVGNADGRVHRFDPDDGGESWSVHLGATVSSGPVVVGDVVVVGLIDGNLVAIGGER